MRIKQKNKINFYRKRWISFDLLVKEAGQDVDVKEKISTTSIKNYLKINHRYSSVSSMCEYIKRRDTDERE